MDVGVGAGVGAGVEVAVVVTGGATDSWVALGVATCSVSVVESPQPTNSIDPAKNIYVRYLIREYYHAFKWVVILIL